MDICSETQYFSQPKKLKICGGRHRHSGPFEQRCAPRTRVPMPRKWCFRRYSALVRPYCLVQCSNLTSHSQVFYNDIRNLLSMEDMWRFRDKPVPLDFDLIQSDQFSLRGQAINAVGPSTDGILRPVNGDSSVDLRLNGSIPDHKSSSSSSAPKGSTAKSSHGLKDQRSLSLRENLTLFVSRLVSLILSPSNCAFM